ncbi:ribonuclease HII [Clostridium saccharoperbutylacetonicum]|uniref:Ribonuclease HII n=1 Tax=Clostridium saccharoperbutylacetonicum N1-4(HMT) TaxID=931276 RepID=M1MU65_9CLOT|nr:ribonuclease HII [Clostridium saccharoperbutylacetonicum]AGF55092.1 ribonuclease HII [Clostridium saccharoperbutylacetonicum N1-4(HMT)]NRT64199.1 ribonuclease HII [Clostridium saccharoperbutylacetonicum]NSB27566.1 ribonuclease HII [Clostridium saccharoperbutylacetonicum]NSB41055.1 ribonuclease HII [Clostridium saccharoperbutylacetonicum]
MRIINEGIAALSFSEIKAEISQIPVIDYYRNGKLSEVIKCFENEKRKNVLSIKTRIEKELDSYLTEINRVKKMYEFDKAFGNYKYVAGVDEVGRGPLAGPIVACSVILDLNVLDEDLILYLNDSKKVKESKREELSEIIKEKAVSYSIAVSSNEEIDEKGIAFSNNKVFLDSCNSLTVKPDLVLSDGYLVKNIQIENKSVIKGDTKSASIAAASIVAKVYRDNLMKKYAEKYPYYDFEKNVGYGTPNHIEALKAYGKCEIHRNSFLTKLL